MKKFIFTLLALMAILPASADSYFTMGVNDTVRIHPMFLGAQKLFEVRALLDGRIDHWSLDITYPVGLDFNEATPLGGMSVPFVNRNGEDSVYNAPFSVLNSGTLISSTITKLGYWDYNNDGVYDTYGTIKWEAGEYDPMFQLRLEVRSYFRTGYMIFDGFLSCTPDMRPGYNTTYAQLYKIIYFYVGYMLGDVTGDDVINIADVTMLIDYLLNQEQFNEFQLDAADVNDDGVIGIADVSALYDLMSEIG